MVAGALWLFAAVVVAVGSGLLLYVLVRAEHDEREVLDRAAGERVARRDASGDVE